MPVHHCNLIQQCSPESILQVPTIIDCVFPLCALNSRVKSQLTIYMLIKFGVHHSMALVLCPLSAVVFGLFQIYSTFLSQSLYDFQFVDFFISSALLFWLCIVFGSLQYGFRIDFSIPVKKVIGILIGLIGNHRLVWLYVHFSCCFFLCFYFFLCVCPV